MLDSIPRLPVQLSWVSSLVSLATLFRSRPSSGLEIGTVKIHAGGKIVVQWVWDEKK
jgi:hypothetical protein